MASTQTSSSSRQSPTRRAWAALEVTRTYVDQCVLDFNAGRLDAVTAASAKWWATDVQKRTVDRCLQLHGGRGYLRECRAARAFLDTRMMPIYGGTNEVMKEI